MPAEVMAGRGFDTTLWPLKAGWAQRSPKWKTTLCGGTAQARGPRSTGIRSGDSRPD